MIAYIRGEVGAVTEQAVVLENGGIGWLVNASAATLSRLPKPGEPTLLHTHLQVKEDGLSLHGFLSPEELAVFKLLISVSGVGVKVAAGILGVLSPAQIAQAIANDDAAAFSKAPGVGKKTAQRIALELQGKLNTIGGIGETKIASPDAQKQDALEALTALGYSRAESLRAVLEVAEEGAEAAHIIRLALKKLR